VLLFSDGDGRQCSACQTNFVRLRPLAKQTNRQSALPSAANITLLPLPTLVRPMQSPLFLTARMNRQEKPPPIQSCLPGQAMPVMYAKPIPELRLLTIHQTCASTSKANRIERANQPTRRRFSERIKCRSNICGYQRAVAGVVGS
jgi:hypothetical protein